jgi:putative ABC transport system permease protein
VNPARSHLPLPFVFGRFLAKFALGHFRRHRLEAFLCLIGVMLGVAVVVAVDAAVQACVQSFQGAVQSLAERSTHSIFADQGKISDDVYLALARKHLPFPMSPIIDRSVLIAKTTGGPTALAHLMGVDVFSERSLRSFTQLQSSLDSADLRRFLTEPGQVVLVDALADQLGLQTGDSLQLTIGNDRRTAHVLSVVKPQGVARSQLGNIVLADIATAQELTGSLGSIDRIDLKLDTDEQQKQLEAALPPGLTLRTTGQAQASLTELIKAYQLNLNALSLMASFVAVFIVYNSMLISVQQRSKSLAILRCLGASRLQLAATYFAEAMFYAIAGGILGVILGWLLSKGMVGLIATTINDLYTAVKPGPIPFDWAALPKGLLLSIASCLLGAAVPLYLASRVTPINTLRAPGSTSGRGPLYFAVCGLALLASSYGIYRLPTASPVIGFVMAMFIALGFALICPALARFACRSVETLAAKTQLLPLRMAAAGVRRSLGITGVAIAATMLAMAMNVGVRTMVSSFRGALSHWVEQRFAADIFVGPELLVNHKIDATLDPQVRAWVREQPEVARLTEYRARNIDFGGKSIMLTGTDPADLIDQHSLPMKEVASDRPYDPALDALISEPLAGRMKLAVGDTLAISTPAGPRQFHIHAIFFDFGSERGQIMLDRHIYAANWHDDGINSLHVRLKVNDHPDQLAARWNESLRTRFPVVVSSFGQVKVEIMKVFDRTFKVTEVLTWLAGGVAFCGLAGSLLSISLARQRDYSVLAAIGMSGHQAALWMLGQGMLIAWTSAFVAAIAGTALAYVLAYVIQYRSFGWSIPTQPMPRYWLDGLVLASISAIVAAIYPASRLRRTPPAGSLRQE